MKLSTGADQYFQALQDQGIKGVAFKHIGESGIKMPGLVPLALGVAAGGLGIAAGAGLAKSALGAKKAKPLDKKEVQKLVKQEVKKQQQAHTGPGINGISFFS